MIYIPGNYIAYIRRISGIWEVHNLRKKHTQYQNDTNKNTSTVIYVCIKVRTDIKFDNKIEVIQILNN